MELKSISDHDEDFEQHTNVAFNDFMNAEQLKMRQKEQLEAELALVKTVIPNREQRANAFIGNPTHHRPSFDSSHASQFNFSKRSLAPVFSPKAMGLSASPRSVFLKNASRVMNSNRSQAVSIKEALSPRLPMEASFGNLNQPSVTVSEQ